MPSNLAIDDKLLARALRIGGLASKKATVNQALKEFIARRRRLAAVEQLGSFDFAEDWDYKADRKAR
jgi:Arc/MetJ family transcription regulator